MEVGQRYRIPGIGLTDECVPPYMCRELDSGTLRERQSLSLPPSLSLVPDLFVCFVETESCYIPETDLKLHLPVCHLSAEVKDLYQNIQDEKGIMQ